ncbi:MAG: TetR/AcrR family transcriptional regulator [Bryobacterales bacterium]|nr:TetR/AcrR family transcriptional regulator [Bryobacterales bacterium]
MNPEKSPPLSTKDRILDAAEVLFADLGFEATSLRTITQIAGVNLAAVNYHFQSKEALLLAVLGRRAEQVNGRRLELLDRAEAKGDASVEEILEALFRPVLESGPTLPRLLVRLQYLESQDLFRKVFDNYMKAVKHRMLAAMRKAVPHLEPADIMLRVVFSFGSFASVLIAGVMTEVVSEGGMKAPELEERLQAMIQFAAAGMRAPVVRKPAKTGERICVE